jgi:hypothetical protein
MLLQLVSCVNRQEQSHRVMFGISAGGRGALFVVASLSDGEDPEKVTDGHGGNYRWLLGWSGKRREQQGGEADEKKSHGAIQFVLNARPFFTAS